MLTDKQRYTTDYHKRLTRVLEYIDSHLCEPLLLENLSKVACSSPSIFTASLQPMRGSLPDAIFSYCACVMRHTGWHLILTRKSLISRWIRGLHMLNHSAVPLNRCSE